MPFASAVKYRVRRSYVNEIKEVSKFMSAQGAQLSRREKEVLDLLCQGLKDKEIARHLGIDDATVRTHVSRACVKLGAQNRVQLGRLAPPPTNSDW